MSVGELDRGQRKTARDQAGEDAQAPHDAPPRAWITRGSDAWCTLAAALANAIIVAALARFIGGEPVSERRIFLGAVAYSICIAATFSLTGFLVGDAIRAA